MNRRNLLSLFMMLFAFSTVTHAGNEVLAEMKFSVDSRGKRNIQILNLISTHNVAVIEFGMLWRGFDSTLHENGFELNHLGDTATFISPELPVGCRVEVIQGAITGDPSAFHPMRMSIRGDSCAFVLKDFLSEPFEFTASDVPGLQDSSLSTPTLRVTVE